MCPVLSVGLVYLSLFLLLYLNWYHSVVMSLPVESNRLRG